MSSEELADRFHLLLRVRARDLAPPAGFVVQKGSAGAPPGVCRSVATVCPSWGPHVEPGERKDAHRRAGPCYRISRIRAMVGCSLMSPLLPQATTTSAPNWTEGRAVVPLVV